MGEPLDDRYVAEREKRQRPDALFQYIDPITSEKHTKFTADPWFAVGTPPAPLPAHTKILIVGGGFGGIFFAAEFLHAGFSHDDLLLVDLAGSFGGTWYWNRYPGLQCDVESYIYLPLLEETGYVPKNRYSKGEEIREYTQLLVEKYQLNKIARFGTKVEKCQWDEEAKEWIVDVKQLEKKEDGDGRSTIRAKFVCQAPGVLHQIKLPRLEGIEAFEGPSFHTARWDYGITGGSPTKPELTNLAGKKVAIIGTGTTSVQVVPHVAKWASHLYVVQRTPAAVDVRGQRPTDEEVFKKSVARGPGWQLARQENFMDTTMDIDVEENMVDDAWTTFKGAPVMIGSPKQVTDGTLESLAAYVADTHKKDFVRQERIRQRVESIVKDPETANKLKPWYAGWCKRPAFHDEYLDTFNAPNVTLVDTDGKGVDSATPSGLVINGKHIDVDVLIWSTGFNPVSYTFDPASRGAMQIVGRDGVSMTESWLKKTPRTLLGITAEGFPNMILMNPVQGGASIVFTYAMRVMAQHSAYIVKAACERAKQSSKDANDIVLEPTSEAVDEWEQQIAGASAVKAPIAGCTPGWLNAEGALNGLVVDTEEQHRMMKLGAYGLGMKQFRIVLDDWQREGSLKGLTVTF